MSRGRSFDLIARPYRWGEYLSFGPALMRCRRDALPFAAGAARALVLGDGDGRFTARLLGSRPKLQVDSVDQSAAMLRLARERCRPFEERVHFYQADALELNRVLPVDARYDFVATHFFLDCLTTEGVAALAARVHPRLQPGARWTISEFRARSLAAKVLVRGLYLLFRIAAGLRVQQLPAYEQALTEAGFVRVQQRLRLGGLLVTSCWQATASEAGHSHPG